MNKETTIADVLRNYPKGTKLYSPVLGNLTLQGVSNKRKYPILVNYEDDRRVGFMADGRYVDVDGAECCIFPSYKIRNWDFLLWKKGDVVEGTKTGRVAMFEEWANNEYTSFKAKWVMKSGYLAKDITLPTSLYFPCDADKSKWFVREIEKMKNGKFNPDTLEIEPSKPECPFKPFDKVLVRSAGGIWLPSLYSHYDHKSAWHYITVGSNNYEQCIPYNEETAHLAGTTAPYGEK